MLGFDHAIRGIVKVLKSERNFSIQLIIAVLVIIAGFYFSISSTEWIIILFACCFVLALEMVNSAIEKVCNFISTAEHPTIKWIKEGCAGAVLIAAIGAWANSHFFTPKLPT